MIATITALTALSFAAIYPLVFWISAKEPLQQNFHHFHIGLPAVMAGVMLAFLPFIQSTDNVKTYIIIWAISLLLIAFNQYKKHFASAAVLSVPCLAGIIAFLKLQEDLVAGGALIAFSGLIGAFIFVSAMFAMNLGHWYLNVHGLPIKHLRNATLALAVFLFIRLLFDGYMLLTFNTVWQGEEIPLFKFITTIDGFLLMVPILFGILFPLIGLIFAKGTLDLKNTQATTGILYVLLCAILLGDIAFKYFLIKFNIPL